MKLKVDQDKCIGCGTCTILAMQSFELGEDGKAHAIIPHGDEEDLLQQALDACPVGAIEEDKN